MRRSKTCFFKVKLFVSYVFDSVPEMYPLVKYLTDGGSFVYCTVINEFDKISVFLKLQNISLAFVDT